MKYIPRKIESKTNPIRATYTTDSMRKVTDPETGVTAVKRWVEEHQVQVTVQLIKEIPAVFFHGARIA